MKIFYTRFSVIFSLCCFTSAAAQNTDSVQARSGNPLLLPASDIRLSYGDNSLLISNAGFEMGNYSQWAAYIGDNTTASDYNLNNVIYGVYGGMTDPSLSDYSSRHSIMSVAGGTDSICGFPVVAPGFGMYSARLGNILGYHTGELVEWTWVATAADSSFLVSFAAVLEQSAHPAGDGSFFSYLLLDSIGDTIYRRIDEVSSLPVGYSLAPDSIYYLPWETDTLDLSAYTGTPVMLRFIVAGCAHGCHFGYCYADAQTNSPVGIVEDQQAGNDVQVFPNPSVSGIFTVKSGFIKSIEPPMVYDVSGRLVSVNCMQTTEGWTIDLSQECSGVYLLQIKTTTGYSSERIIR